MKTYRKTGMDGGILKNEGNRLVIRRLLASTSNISVVLVRLASTMLEVMRAMSWG